MADYDLGRAKGKVVVDYSSHGAAKAQSELSAFDKQAKASQGTFAKTTEALKRWDDELHRASSGTGDLRRNVVNLRSENGRLVTSFAAGTQSLQTLITKVNNFQSRLSTTSTVFAAFTAGVRRSFAELTQTKEGLKEVERRLNMFARAGLHATEGAKQLKNGMDALVRSTLMATKAMALISAGAVGLKYLGVVIAGIVDAAKQLSGVLGAIPGGILTIVTGLGVLKLGLSGIKDAFKTGMSSGEEFLKGLEKLSPAMQNVAVTINRFAPSWKNLQKMATERIFKNFERDVENLNNKLLPTVTAGVGVVADAFNRAKDAVVRFLVSPRTAADLGESFRNTGKIIDNVTRGINPLLSALRDIAIVGQQALTDLSSGFGELASKFAAWVAGARASGELRQWIDNGIQGLKDLGAIIRHTGGLLMDVFNSMPGASGAENALSKIRNWLEEIRVKVRETMNSQPVQRFWASMQNIANHTIEIIKAALVTLGKAAESNFSTLWSDQFVTAAKAILATINTIIDALNKIPGFWALVSSVAALAVAIKGIGIVLAPVIAMFKVFGGARKILLGIGEAVGTLALSFSGKFGTALTGAGLGIQAFAAKFSAALLALSAVWMTLESAAKGFEQKIQNISNANVNATESTKGFAKAFEELNGAMGKGIIREATRQWEDYIAAQETAAASTTGWFDRVGASWNKVGDYFKDWKSYIMPWASDTKAAVDTQADSIDNAAKASQNFLKTLEELKVSQEVAGRAITGTDAEYQAFLKTIGATGDQLKSLNDMRQSFLRVKGVMDDMGPGAIELSKAIAELGDKSKSTADKVSDLESALRSAGLVPGEAADTIRDYEEQLDNITQAQTDLIGSADATGSALIGLNGTLNQTSKTGRELHDIFSQTGTDTRAMAIATGDAAGAWQQSHDRLLGLLNSLGIFGDQAEQIINSYLLPKHTFEVYTKVTGDDVSAALQAIHGDIERRKAQGLNLAQFDVKVNANPDKVKEELEKAGAIVGDFDPATGTIKLTIPNPAEFDATLDNIQQGINQAVPPVITPQIAPPTPASPNDGGLFGPGGGESFGAGGKRTITGMETPEEMGERTTEGYAKGITNNPEVVTSAVTTINTAAQQQLQVYTEEWTQSGQKLMEAFAQGILNGQTMVTDAVTQVVTRAANLLPKSPAKEGPFSGQGWTLFRGRKLSQAFAQGIQEGTPEAREAASGLVGRTSNGIDSGITRFIQDATEFSGILQHMFDFANSIGDIVMKSLKVIDDLAQTFSGGRAGIFGPKSYTRQVSDAELEKRRQDALQQKVLGAVGGASPQFALGGNGTGVTSVNGDSSQADIAKYIVGQAIAAGFSPEEAIGIAAYAYGESKLNPTANGGIQGGNGTEADRVLGLFQMKEGFAGLVTPADRMNPEKAVPAYLRELAKHRGTGDIYDQLFATSVGGPGQGGRSYEQIIRDFLATPNVSKGVARAVTGSMATQFGDRVTMTPGAVSGAGAKPIYTPGTTELPQWVHALAAQFGLTASTYTTGGSLHQGGYAIDFNGDPANRERLAQYIMNNLAGQTLQLIYRGSRDYGIAGGVDVSGRYYGEGDQGYPGHMDHVHWATDVAPILADANATALPQAAGTDPTKIAPPQGGYAPPDQQFTVGPNGQIVALPMQHLPDQFAGAAPGPVNPITGLPYTDQEMANLQQAQGPNVFGGDFTAQQLAEINSNTGYMTQSMDQQLAQMASQDSLLQQAIAINQGTLQVSDADANAILQHLDTSIADQNALNTPASRATASQLESIKSGVMQNTGMGAAPDALSVATSIAQGVSGLVGDVFGLVNSVFKSIASAKEITGVLTRGVANTEDIYRIVEQIQSFVELGQNIAGLVSSGLGFAAGIVGTAGGAAGAGAAAGGDSGATAAASQAVAMALGSASAVASIVAQVFSAVNAAIDIGQEIYRMSTKYLGRTLLSLFNLPGVTDVKYLLDTVEGQLKVYSSENPQYKTPFNMLGKSAGINYPGRPGATNTFTIYQGPGQDPRDTMSQAMFAVKSSSVGAFGYE